MLVEGPARIAKTEKGPQNGNNIAKPTCEEIQIGWGTD